MMVQRDVEVKRLQEEKLRLKLEVLRLRRLVERDGQDIQDMDETKRDLIADLMQANDSLRKRVEELEGNEQERSVEPEYESVQIKMVDASCETKMSSSDINVLLQRSIELKNRQEREQELTNHIEIQKEQLSSLEQQLKQQMQHIQHLQYQQQQQERERLQQQQQLLQQQLQQQQRQQQQQQQQQQQFQPDPLYDQTKHSHHNDPRDHPHPPQQQQPRWHAQQTQPNIAHQIQNPRDSQASNVGQMTADEKESLDKLFELNGRLTTARDKLRAIVLN